MRASGLSVHQIAKTVIICGAIISLFVFWLNDKFIPRSLAMTQKIKSTMGETKKAKEKKEETIRNLFMLGLRNRLFFINKFALSTNTMEDIIILEDDEHQNVIRKIVAKKGLYQDNLWKFYQCITYNFDQNGQIAGEPQYFEEEVMPITETPSDFINQRQRPELMTIAQLEDYIWRLSRSGASTLIRNLKVDLYHRFTAPFSNLIIVLLGIPFSMMLKRRATGLSSVGLAIMVGFLYYALDAIFIAFGKGGALIPILGASLSHIVALTFGLYLISALP
jgi:lipopolysaccharide export system permease protein